MYTKHFCKLSNIKLFAIFVIFIPLLSNLLLSVFIKGCECASLFNQLMSFHLPTNGGLLLRSPGLYKNPYSRHPSSKELLPSITTSGLPPTPVILNVQMLTITEGTGQTNVNSYRRYWTNKC